MMMKNSKTFKSFLFGKGYLVDTSEDTHKQELKCQIYCMIL